MAPFGKPVFRIVSPPEEVTTETDKACDCRTPALSTTVTLNWKLPLAGAVPLKVPLGERDSHEGKPFAVQVYGGFPPFAESVKL